jgi:hypothetical protein
MAWSRRRPRGAALAALLLLLHAPAPAYAQDAKTHLAAADTAAAKKDWAAAASAYRASNAAEPSVQAAEGLANAEYQQKHDGDAYAAYGKFVQDWGDKVAPYKKILAESRMKEIAARTGELTITVSEPGAAIAIDDKPAGVSPLPSPLRLPPGPHRVRITKDGFLPFDQTPASVVGVGAALDAKLQPESAKGRVSVREKTGQPLRVLVDGVDQGDSPWAGVVDPGDHQVAGRGPGVAAAPQRVTVARGKTAEVELVAQSATAPLRIVTSDGKGTIYLDDKLVGEGQFTGDVPAGAHRVKVVREGYDTFEEQVDLKEKEPLVRSVTMKLVGKVETSAIQKETRGLEGFYGGFGLLGLLGPAGMGSTPEQSCDAANPPAELVSCSKGTNLGAGVDGFFGYHWDPVGVELFLGGHYDHQAPSRTWVASSNDLGIGSDPPRTEDFALYRVTALGAIRIRLTLQGEKLRFSAAAGVGLSNSWVFMKRVVTSTQDPTLQDGYAPGAQSYLGPVLSIDPSIQYRLTPGVAVALGITMLVESPRAFDQIPTTPAQKTGHSLGPNPLSTPSYELASGAEVFLGPFVGMMFGP